MRHLTALFFLASLSSTALAGPFSKESRVNLEPANSPALQEELAEAEADYSEAWRAYLTERRALQVERLTAYADDGVFPVNTSEPGLVNLFMDEEGRRCAMAHLIWEDGEKNLVKVYASIDNDVRLGEITDGGLFDWMLTSGLTQQEAAFIQVPDFRVGPQLPLATQEQLITMEQQRLRQHFTAAILQVEHYSEHSVDAALLRLGDKVLSPPPGTKRGARGES